MIVETVEAIPVLICGPNSEWNDRIRLGHNQAEYCYCTVGAGTQVEIFLETVVCQDVTSCSMIEIHPCFRGSTEDGDCSET
jgi:hypothetical protein